MDFRDREKKRQLGVAQELFTADALSKEGTYHRHSYPFCLADDCSSENLWEGLRKDALDYFDACEINWHAGFRRPESGPAAKRFPSGHLCDSQSFCVNVWWPFTRAPERLAAVLRGLGYPVAEVLPIISDSRQLYVAFEWIGEHNYLGEGRGGKPRPDEKRARGALCTSADAMVRFRRHDGQVQIILVEWKYTEFYAPKDIRFSESGTDRLNIYAPHLNRSDSPFARSPVPQEALFFDPFYQLLRLQLLAAAMERANEMSADIVSVLHLVPHVNRELLEGITSPKLKYLDSNIHDVWRRIVGDTRFVARHVDQDVLPLVVREAPDSSWAEWLQRRYAGMA